MPLVRQIGDPHQPAYNRMQQESVTTRARHQVGGLCQAMTPITHKEERQLLLQSHQKFSEPCSSCLEPCTIYAMAWATVRSHDEETVNAHPGCLRHISYSLKSILTAGSAQCLIAGLTRGLVLV